MSEATEVEMLDPPHLLLVEDNPLHVRLVRTMIADMWPEFDNLDHVARLDHALRRVAEQRPDCVLLDLVLPDADGLDAVRAMLAVAPTVPIVVLSSHDDDAIAAEAVRRGAQDYLVKGTVTAVGLSRSIRFAIERHRSKAESHSIDLSDSQAEAGVAVLDVSGSVIVGEPALAAMLRRGLDEIVGVPLSTLTHADDLGRWEEALAARKPDHGTYITTRFMRGDGTPVRVRVELRALADESGDAAAFLARYQPLDAATTGASEPALSASA